MPDAGQDTGSINTDLPSGVDSNQSDLNSVTTDPTNETPTNTNSEVTTLDLTEVTTLMQQSLEKQDKIIQHQQDLQDINVIYFCIFIGLILGYLGVKGLTKPWK